ncbi:hypothetical protein [Synechococcus sp. CBW1108]|uniref:hypothetical protein n=1 Tax=Synechococcus sp. CBW1108 TaxID=1353147 RepID=UPI0018CCDA4E|nr:hypothetical protein [Synechococcus sp. CBW1108]QPN71453.1 hypothetical protein H8F27_07840 [Synechococcus sp. CBW1108]
MADLAPESEYRRWRFLGFDGQAWMQAIGGLVIGLIALYSSYDHIAFGSTKHKLNRQWGVWLIASSLAVVAVDAQLASRSRRREEDRRIQDACTRREDAWARRQDACAAAEDRSRADQERSRADQERNRAAEARKLQAEAAERQGQGIALLRGAALLSARVQLDPSDELNRARLNAYLALLAEQDRIDRQEPGAQF